MATRSVCILVLVLGLVLCAMPEARACGHCMEDKIAATYDYAVVSAARRNGRTVVFTELHGVIAPTSRLSSWIRQQVEASAGVIRGTVRVSLEPGALSFVCESGSTSVSAALRDIGQRLARRGLSLDLIEAQGPRARERVRS